MWRVALLALAVAGCSGPESGPDGAGGGWVMPTWAGGGPGAGGGAPDAGPGSCATRADLTPCLLDGGAGACLSGDCVPVPPCDGRCAASGPTFRLPPTGLRVCVGPGSPGVITCPSEPGTPACATEPRCGQDAQYAPPPGQRFTVSTPRSERVVTDTATGLVWQGCVVGQSGAGCAGAPTLSDWYDAVEACETSTWGGFDDWVLPDSFEAMSIVDYGRTSPAIDVTAFANAPSRFREDPDQWWAECLWTSSDYARDASAAWASMVNSGDMLEGSGTTYHLHDKAADGWEGCYARCVRRRAHAPAVPRFIRHEAAVGQPVVGDTVTGLTWQGCAAGQVGPGCSGDASFIDWEGALAACEGLGWGGRSDWRLPNIIELRSLVDLSRASPAIDPRAFPNTPFYGVGHTEQNAGHFWSSTGRDYNDFALYAEFGSGFTHFYVQPEGRHVRCVRGP